VYIPTSSERWIPTSDPLHVAFVWHMHQPYYRSARTGSFEMPWARMHALKDYLDMVQTLSDYPALHQTFNLVPSLVEQLEHYASGVFSDVYWEHTLKPAVELDRGERAFVVERMCELPDHPRARFHPRYLELAQKRESLAPLGWDAAARTFSTQELRDLQVWFNLAWFGNSANTHPALRELVERGRGFDEEDKRVLASCQASVISKVLPAYREAAGCGQVELTTSPYFHPILPLLCDSDSARIASQGLALPPRRFAHPEDAAQQLAAAVAKHTEEFGDAPQGVWCSEMAVGETVIPLLVELGFSWTIADAGVLARSLSGVTANSSVTPPDAFGKPYLPYRLVRDTGEIAIVFRDHTLSDLIGFSYRSWDSREAAADLLSRLRTLQRTPAGPLAVIALDGENAWEYYPNDGHDFLRYLYEGISADASLRCVTVSEHLRESPAGPTLDWLHTGSWVSADLTTWCGTDAQNAAWDQLHRARDFVAGRRRQQEAAYASLGPAAEGDGHDTVEQAWRHILVAEGSDWFWWFGDHHHTQLDAVWDEFFRLRLEEVYRLLGVEVPASLAAPLVGVTPPLGPTMPTGPITPSIDGTLADPAEWDQAGRLAPAPNSAMQPSVQVLVHEVRFGWNGDRLCLLIIIDSSSLREGLWLELAVRSEGGIEGPLVRVVLREAGEVEVLPLRDDLTQEEILVAWKDVVEMSLPPTSGISPDADAIGSILRVGFDQVTAQEYRY
jgi:alpha-amylase/alpha-mannosidase (GH57 family)